LSLKLENVELRKALRTQAIERYTEIEEMNLPAVNCMTFDFDWLE